MKKQLKTLALSVFATLALMVSVGAAEVSNEADLRDALTTGGDYTLTANITLTESVTIPESATVTLDTADFTVTYDPADNTEVEWAIYNDGSLTITGESSTNEVVATVAENKQSVSLTTTPTEYEFVLADVQSQGFFYSTNYLKMSDVTVYSEVANACLYENDTPDEYRTYYGGHLIYSNGGDLYLEDVNALSMYSSNDGGVAAVRAETGTDYFEVVGGTYVNASKVVSSGYDTDNSTNYNYNPYAFTSSATNNRISPDLVYGYRGGLSTNAGYCEVLGGEYYGYYWHPYYFSGDRGSVECVIKNDATFYSNRYSEALYIANKNKNGDGGINASAACTIEGGEFNGFIQLGEPLGSLSISGGTYPNTTVKGGSYNTVLGYLKEDANITIGSSSISTNTTIPAGATVTIAEGATLTVPTDKTLINSGTINGDITNSGTIFNMGTINGTVSGIEAVKPVAAIVDTETNEVTGYYATLADAIPDAAVADYKATVVLVDDIETATDYTVTATGGQTAIIIDLNGHTWTNTAGFTVDGGSTVTLIDSKGTGELSTSGGGDLSTAGELYIDCDVTLGTGTSLETTANSMEQIYIKDGATVTNRGTITVVSGDYLTVRCGGTLINHGTLNNEQTIVIEDGATVTSDGTVNNTGVFEYGYLPSEEVFGSVAYITKQGSYDYYPTLEAAIDGAGDQETITLLKDVTVSSTISIDKPITIKGATGKETISTTINNLIYITAPKNVTFDNLGLTVANTGIGVTSAGNGATVTIKDCTIASDPDGAAYVIVGDTTVGASSDNYYYDLTFTGNTVTGQFQKPIHDLMGDENTLTVAGNSFTGSATDGNNRSVTIIVDDSGDTTTNISVTGNVFDTLQKAVSVDKWAATPTITMTGNSFVNCEYSLDISSTNEFNDGLSLAYNYFDGTLPVVLDSNDDTAYDNDDNTSDLIFYPYYSDSALTTLVYEDETEKAPDVVVSDALNSDKTDAEKAGIIAAVNTDSIVDNDALLGALNELDEKIVEENGDLIVANNATSAVTEEDYKVTKAGTTKGLGIAVFGKDAATVEAKIGVDIHQTVCETKTVNGESVVETKFEATPYKEISGTKTTVSNGELNAPVTFQLYLPDVFADTNRASVQHESDDAKILSVQKDTNGKPFTWVTTNGFSTFTVTYMSYQASSSGVSSFAVSVTEPTGCDISVSSPKVAMGKTVTITADLADGYTLVAYKHGDSEIALKDLGNGKYSFVMPGTSVVVTAVTAEETPVHPFVDVDENAYYYDAMLWAVENGITAGTTDTTFAPGAPCTRGQIVTFLYRAAGSPAVTGDTDFVDVDETAYYHDAMVWAVQNGITAGTSATTFDPSAPCTRGQIVTFLWRAAGTPDVSGSALDVNADSYCYDAVIWAVDEGITTGYAGGTFGAPDACNRGQIVTFLYRYMGE